MRALAHLGQLDLLRTLYGQVLVPPAVEWELFHPPIAHPVVNIAQLGFAQVQAPHDQLQVNQLLRQLDLGEAEALVLACEVQASAILIDERRGRTAAKRLGLHRVGTLGVLMEARRNGLIQAVRPLMDDLENNLKFFISAKLRADILRLAGESP